MAVDREAYRFFREHAGGIVGENAKGAIELARAEVLLERAQDLGVAVARWEMDDEPYDPGDVCSDEEAREKFESGAWVGPFGCIVEVDGVGNSLWGIVFSGADDVLDPYARVIRAELACGLRDDLAQAIGDTLDAREGVSLV
jgi:hypothetical protein